MRSAKSSNSLANQPNQQLQLQLQQQHQHQTGAEMSLAANSAASPTSPICRCRVMYLGSSVPHITKDGLQGIQEPLRELYPDKASQAAGNAGIDSWLSVWSNGILIENVDESGREVKRFFKIEALHYCAAVKFVPQAPSQGQPQANPYTTLPNGNSASMPKFLPLDSPYARQTNNNPPIFASILRRTTGIKVLECHAFICKREAAANALVRCCFHAYADTMYAKQIGADVNGLANDTNNNSSASNHNVDSPASSTKHTNGRSRASGLTAIAARRSKSIAALNDADPKRIDSWTSNETDNYSLRADSVSHRDIYNQPDRSQMIRRKSMNEQNGQNCDSNGNLLDRQSTNGDQLRQQHKLSKSMHHLNQNGHHTGLSYNQVSDYDAFPSNQSTSASCINAFGGRFMQQVPQPFYNPYASRVPSYPPQNLIEASNGGTLKSIKSVATNSIASTLLRSKKHAKAMSVAQLNHDKIISFHQPHSNATTMVGPLIMPPIPPMFLPHLQGRQIINGSQTMKVPNRSMVPIVGQPMNFEAMTPKEMKKLLKKSAKYGIDPNKFGENGLPIMPLQPQPMQMPYHLPQPSESGTMISRSGYSDIYGNDMPDMGLMHGIPQLPRGPMMDPRDQQMMKPILVKPNPDFIKSKEGKKWLKQQKEFKKLLPTHLEGLPIIFGPPPIDALEPAGIPNGNIQPPTFIQAPPPPVPMMDSSGYYNPHPFYGQTGRASAASTLVRYSPNSQAPEHTNGLGMMPHTDGPYPPRSSAIYGNRLENSSSSVQGNFVGDGSSMIYPTNADARAQAKAENDLRHRRRHHMVEQSVISLGEENDYDDEERASSNNDYYSSTNHESETDTRPRHARSAQSGNAGMQRDCNSEHIMNTCRDKSQYGQQCYERVAQNGDDQGSYSSGIYKRGHMNERAFSYSIRQEHKSGGGNSDGEYANRHDIVSDSDQLEQEYHMNHENHNNNQHPGNIYQERRNQGHDFYRSQNDSQSIPVNELTARLESQLNMKSFANSRVKSHI